jgi:hypothetical protein
LGTIARNRYFPVGVVSLLLVVFFSCVAVAFTYVHGYNGVDHGLAQHTDLAWAYVALTDAPGNQWSTVEGRHYFDDGSYNRQCGLATYGLANCGAEWGSAPCQKRYVGGTDGLMPRHWVRRGPSCPGDIHG